jgi:hypothetical protein
MLNIEDAPRLRELCERASKEYDHQKLLELIRQINELLEKRRSNPAEGEPGKQAQTRDSLSWLGFSPSEWLATFYLRASNTRTGVACETRLS